GEYRLFLEKFYPCKSNNLIQYNLYLSKETLNTTQLKGNFTFTIPLDDTIILDGNLASWDSIGGWKSNSMGTYTTTGLDMKELEDLNFPKVYFYGKYKLTVKKRNAKNEVLCCLLDISVASWDSIGGWKSNSAVYMTKNACSNWQKVLENVWNTLFTLFNVSNTSCPIAVGEYRIVFEKIYSCESTNSIQFNLYINKKTLSITELKGNFTNMVPFGDTFTLDINAASWDSIGGWKPNSMVYITKNACSNWKKILGNVWYTLFKSFNVSNTSCPIPVGTYITTGVDLKKLEDLNVPKVYFYGKYKLTAKIKNVKNKVFGCVVLDKKTLSVTELKGNLTFSLPLDDTVSLDINAASWGSIGGWKPNSMVYITKNACSNWKKILGNVWNTLLQSYNIPSTSCPIPSGTYTTTGVDLKELEDLKVPKEYFYGKYKLTVKVKNVKYEVLGCVEIEHSLVRPRETSTD
ncbi:Uncharacterized protein FWK35_00022582, partial [Aphis craccivora]